MTRSRCRTTGRDLDGPHRTQPLDQSCLFVRLRVVSAALRMGIVFWYQGHMGRRTTPPFDAQRFLESAGLGKRVVLYAPKAVIFSQGDPCDSVMYVRSGAIELAVISHEGKEAIVGTLGPGDFLGEGALAGQPL